MIHVLRYEPQGQRQRFEPREQQRGEREGQDRHIHLHFYLNLTFRASQERSSHPTTIRLTRIFAALVGATLMTIFLFLPADRVSLTWLFNIAQGSLLLGLLLAWTTAFVGGLPLLREAWNSTPRVRILLALPFVPLLILLFPVLLQVIHVGPSLGDIGSWLGSLQDTLFGGRILRLSWLLSGYFILSALMLNSAIRRAAIADQWLRHAFRLSFVVVGAMGLLLLDGLLLSFFLLLVAPITVVLSFLLGLCIAVIVAVHALFSRSSPRESTQARPKDASLSDVDSFQEPRGYRD